MKNRFKSACIATCVLFATPVWSATGDIQYDATVADYCAITVDQNGVLGPRPDLRVLNSRVANGGSPGRATVVTSASGYTLSTDTPAAFTAEPVADTTPETFTSLFRSVGATTIAETDVPTSLNAGSHTVRVTLIARKSPGDIFVSGTYSAVVVLRCE